MKIAYVVINANRREGTSRAVLEVAERLASRHEVHLLARTVEGASLDRITWTRIGGPRWPEVADFTSFVARCDRHLIRTEYDIVHSAGPNTTRADVYTIQTVHPVKRRIMSELGAHTSAGLPRRVTRSLYDRAVLSVESRAYRSTGPRGLIAYLPVSRGTRRELEAEYPVTNALIEETPNGADLERFNPRNRSEYRQVVRKRHGLDPNDFVAVFSGGDWVRKGLRIAIEAVARLGDERARLLVVGDDPLSDEFKRRVAADGLADRVVFAGFQQDVHCYYAAGDVFLFPTAYEAFSLATIEAAASGLPVLMPDVSGGQELVGTSDAGFLIPRDPEAIASRLSELVDDPALLERMGSAARAHVENNFSWDLIAHQTESVYERLLQQRQAAVAPNGASE